jgi:hypothetical protein
MFAASRASWYPISDGLPQHETFPPEFGGGVASLRPEPEPKPGVASGSCLCGDVAWELEGSPERMYNCHCSRCRKARSAAHATNAFFPSGKLTWLRGENRVERYALPGAKRFGQAFCRRCGSKVPRIAPTTSYATVPCGSLDSPLEQRPPGHIFVADKAPWFEISDGLPQWEGYPA